MITIDIDNLPSLPVPQDKDLAAKLKWWVDALVDILTIPHAPTFLLQQHRQMVADTVCELLRLSHPTAKVFAPLFGEWDDEDANEALRIAKTHGEGTPERERWTRIAYRLACAPVLNHEPAGAE